jgi:hypothetical protein
VIKDLERERFCVVFLEKGSQRIRLHD